MLYRRGDTVERINENYNYTRVGGIYTVREDCDSEGGALTLKEVTGNFREYLKSAANEAAK